MTPAAPGPALNATCHTSHSSGDLSRRPLWISRQEKCFATMNSKMYAVTNTSAHHLGSALGTVGDASPTAVLVTSVAASWAAKSSELKCAAPDLDCPGTNGALEDLLRPVPGWHDKVHRLEDARDGWVPISTLEGPSIIANASSGKTRPHQPRRGHRGCEP